jgi:membrane associated rhomboid family serine protease
VTFLVLIAIMAFLGYRGTTPEDRAVYVQRAVDVFKRVKAEATRPRPEYDAFREALRARSDRVIVTPAIVGINAALFGLMLFGAGALGDTATLLGWGASLGIRTTNGEWWRLLSSSFVHVGLVHVFINSAILLQLGSILERLVGRLTFVAVYLAAGVFTGIINLSSYPVEVTVGTSGAIFGLYGLFFAALAWQTFHLLMEPMPEVDIAGEQGRIIVPLLAMKRVGICAVVFVGYGAFNGFMRTPELTGFLAGFAIGLVLARRAIDELPEVHHGAVVSVVTAALALACAIPLRNIADVKPEIAHVIAIEQTTAATFERADAAFKKGRINAEALARVAERTIVPELQAADARLQALKNVPPEHQPIVAGARDYLRLRSESWRVRADAIRRMNAAVRRTSDDAGNPNWRLQAEARYRSNTAAMGKAEGAERAALQALQKLKPAAAAL